MGPTATWEYVGKISPAIPTLRKLVDHMEDTVNTYRRYKKHTTRSTEDDITRLMAMFQESKLYHRVNEREVGDREKFADIWGKGFDIVLKGESVKRWFENRSQSSSVAYDGIAGDDVAGDDDVVGDDNVGMEEMELENGYGYGINLHHDMWESINDAPS